VIEHGGHPEIRPGEDLLRDPTCPIWVCDAMNTIDQPQKAGFAASARGRFAGDRIDPGDMQ
jgi:hypothetical protein